MVVFWSKLECPVYRGWKWDIYIYFFFRDIPAIKSMPFTNDPLAVKPLNENTQNINTGNSSRVKSELYTRKRKALTSIPNAPNISVPKKKKNLG